MSTASFVHSASLKVLLFLFLGPGCFCTEPPAADDELTAEEVLVSLEEGAATEPTAEDAGLDGDGGGQIDETEPCDASCIGMECRLNGCGDICPPEVEGPQASATCENGIDDDCDGLTDRDDDDCNCSNPANFDRWIQQEADWLQSCQRESGAIGHYPPTPNYPELFFIPAYYGHYASIGLMLAGRWESVRDWLAWYYSHLAYPDCYGVYGSVCDYRIENGQEVSCCDTAGGVCTEAEVCQAYPLACQGYSLAANLQCQARTSICGYGSYDSTDSTAALALHVSSLYAQYDPSFFAGSDRKYQVNLVAAKLWAFQDDPTHGYNVLHNDQLIWALPCYTADLEWFVKYLMDNCENFLGLQAAADIMRDVYHDSASEAEYRASANALKVSIHNVFWQQASQDFAWAKVSDTNGTLSNCLWDRLYPDATAQLFPETYGLIEAGSAVANDLYQRFNTHHPTWVNIDSYQGAPYNVLFLDAVKRRAPERNAYCENLLRKGFYPEKPWPWTSLDSGMLIWALHEWRQQALQGASAATR